MSCCWCILDYYDIRSAVEPYTYYYYTALVCCELRKDDDMACANTHTSTTGACVVIHILYIYPATYTSVILHRMYNFRALLPSFLDFVCADLTAEAACKSQPSSAVLQIHQTLERVRTSKICTLESK